MANGTAIWVSFLTPGAKYVAGTYLQTTRDQVTIRNAPLPPQFHVLDAKPSAAPPTENRASVDLVITNGGSVIGEAELEIIRQHILDRYLLAQPRAMAPFSRLGRKPDEVIPAVQREVEIGFIS